MEAVEYVFGRPSEYRSEYCQMLIEHMAKGYSFESFSSIVDVERTTLYNWEKAHPDFLYAKARAREKSLYHWETLALDHVVSKTETEREGNWSKTTTTSLNAGIYNLQMKNRFGWRDRVEVSGDGKSPIKLAYDATRPKTNK